MYNKKYYNNKYYKNIYINPLLAKFKFAKLYHLWISYFCLIKPARLKAKSRALDVGCGIGNLVFALRKLNIRAEGIEPSTSAQKYCQIPKYCIYKSTDYLPYKNSSFDLVYTNEVLEHIPEKELDKFILEMSRITKKTMIHMICTKDRGKIIYSDKTHQVFKSELWWKNKFEKLGFKTKVGNYFYFFPPQFSMMFGDLRNRGIKSGYFFLEKNN